MGGTEREQRRRPATARRTESDSQRRQVLADAAAGVSPSEASVPGEATRIGRFRCVIYLCGTPHADIAELRKECIEYAEAFCWAIAAVIEDDAGALPPERRPRLRQAVDLIRSGEAGAVVVARRSMISSVTQEYSQTAREIEQASGFLHVMGAVKDAPDGD